MRPLLDHQSGIASRRQLREAGAEPNDLRRWLRSHLLVSVFPGVYVNHNGPLTWSSRAWAAVQRYWPAALVLDTAVDLAGDVIHVGVAEGRSGLRPERGVQVHRLRHLDDRIQWNRSPPRQRLEDAVISLASDQPRRKAVELITDACRSRRTTPGRLHRELSDHVNVKDRHGCSACWTTRLAASSPCWSTPTFAGSSAPTGCRAASARSARPPLRA